MLIISLLLALMISFAWEDRFTHYGKMYGVGYWMRLVSFGTKDTPNTYMFYTGDMVYDEKKLRVKGSILLGHIEVSKEEMKGLNRMQVRVKAWNKFRESNLPLKKSWHDDEPCHLLDDGHDWIYRDDEVCCANCDAVATDSTVEPDGYVSDGEWVFQWNITVHSYRFER